VSAATTTAVWYIYYKQIVCRFGAWYRSADNRYGIIVVFFCLSFIY